MIYTHKSYVSFLKSFVGPTGARTGLKRRLAEALQIQTTYLSKVLKGEAHLNLEQSHRAAKYLGLSGGETDYFLLLDQKSRAGTPELRSYFTDKLSELRSEHVDLKKQLDTDGSLTPSDQQIYYSHWYYSAIDVAISLKRVQTLEDLFEVFDLPRSTISEVVQFLVKTGMIKEENGKLHVGPTYIHLGNDSPEILKHHLNWRLRALKSLEDNSKEDLHYSVVLSLSREDATLLRQRTIDFIKENLKLIEPSPEEVIYCQALDFFKIV